MRGRFDEGLKELSDDLIQMGAIIEEAITKSISALERHDPSMFGDVRDAEIRADQLERAIESRAMRIILQQQPVASDLRRVSTALKMITDMERIADQAVDIAEIVNSFKSRDYIKNPENIVSMATQAVLMVSRSVKSYVQSDLALANEVIDMDDIVDALFVKVRGDLVEIIYQNKDNAEQAIDFIMIAKYLERIADHAVNIAEWVIFNITGAHAKNKQ